MAVRFKTEANGVTRRIQKVNNAARDEGSAMRFGQPLMNACIHRGMARGKMRWSGEMHSPTPIALSLSVAASLALRHVLSCQWNQPTKKLTQGILIDTNVSIRLNRRVVNRIRCLHLRILYGVHMSLRHHMFVRSVLFSFAVASSAAYAASPTAAASDTKSLPSQEASMNSAGTMPAAGQTASESEQPSQPKATHAHGHHHVKHRHHSHPMHHKGHHHAKHAAAKGMDEQPAAQPTPAP